MHEVSVSFLVYLFLPFPLVFLPSSPLLRCTPTGLFLFPPPHAFHSLFSCFVFVYIVFGSSLTLHTQVHSLSSVDRSPSILLHSMTNASVQYPKEAISPPCSPPFYRRQARGNREELGKVSDDESGRKQDFNRVRMLWTCCAWYR